MTKNIGINWRVGGSYGWGIFGLNLVLELLRSKKYGVVLLQPPGDCDQDPLRMMLMHQALRDESKNRQILNKGNAGPINVDATVIHPMVFDFQTIGAEGIKGTSEVGMIFFENTAFSQLGLARARSYDRVLAGSEWNVNVLNQLGLTNVKLAHQGVDLSRFHQAPKLGLFQEKFVIFSGGKLEYRKGQDIVLKAFQLFHKKYPDTLLITNWQNSFPNFGINITGGGIVDHEPQLASGGKGLKVDEWMLECGLNNDSFLECGVIPNSHLPTIIREADIAVFPSRCEGGTNLSAMECMACGVPTILSSNTGHLDLISDNHCLVLEQQTPSKPAGNYTSTEGWGDSEVEELIEKFEMTYLDRQKLELLGKSSAKFMKNWSWSEKIMELTNHIPFNNSE
ncbi:MAG: glycosyltransferase family 4 protein [Pseudomonadota bacterium]|nr:glycosyltransferase family 4 protein [Pseudomonadota bacterium]